MHHPINGLSLYFHQTPGPVLQNTEGQNILVFCLHGYLDHGGTFNDLLKHLRWSSTAWDARGFGQSAWIPAYDYYHFYDYVRDLHACLQSLMRSTQSEKVLLLGHSMGGMIASLYAGVYPEYIAGLINLEGWMIPDSPPEETPARLRQWLTQCGEVDTIKPFTRHASRAAALARMQRQDPQLSPEQLEQLSAPILSHDTEGYFWRHDPLHRTRSPQPFRLDQARACWEAITAPQLLLYGDQSPIRHLPDTPQRMESFGVENPQRNTTLMAIAGAGHNLHLHQSETIAHTIKTWLRTQAQFKNLPLA